MMKMFFTNERTRFITGLVIAIITIYIGLALISFFFTGGADQSKIENVPLADLLTNRGSVENWTGVRGAVLADLLMNRWFGISSFMILFFLGSVGAKLMNLRRVSLLKRFLFCAAMLIWGSMFFAFVFISGYEDTFIYLGGQHGYYLSEVMITNVGIPGTILLLAGVFLIIAIFSSKRTIPFLQSVLSFGWLKNRLKREKKEVLEEEDIHEDDEDEVSDPVVTEQPDERPETEEFVFDTEKEIETARKEESRKKTEVYSTISHDDAFEVTVPQEEEVYDAPNAENQPDEPEDLPGDPRFTVEVPAGDDEVYDASSLGEYDPKLDLSGFRNPPIELLKKYDVSDHQVDMDEQMANQKRIKQTLESFGISIASIKATVGPTITLYEVIPDTGVRISKIKNLEDDIALNLSALGIRIIAPMPGKGTIGIEVPNKDKKVVSMFSVIKSAKFQESTYDIPVVLGKTIQDETFVIDLAKMPHLLVAGATGQGKSVGLNAIITSLLYKKHPSELKLVLVDPKKVELTLYGKLERHFLAKLPGEDDAIITDTHKVIYTLNSLCIEMDARYDLLRKAEVRHVKEYNDKFRHRKLNPQKGHRFLPYIIVVIDEFADLIMTAGREVETPIARIAQLARAVGIHLVIATQRPTTNIITGVIKANFPARIAFRVTSMIDSRTIIDQPGANQLIGRGDMLVSTGNDLTRVQCAFVDTPEIERITEFISNQRGYLGAYELPEYNPDSADNGGSAGGNRANDLSQLDAMFDEVAHFVVQNQQGSTSSIQRRFSIGYNRAGRIMDQLEMAGVVGRAEGSKPREVLIQDVMSLEHLLAHMND